MAKPIGIPNKPMFKVRLLIPRVVVKVERSRILEIRKSKDTGNVYVRFVDGQGKEFIGLLIS